MTRGILVTVTLALMVVACTGSGSSETPSTLPSAGRTTSTVATTTTSTVYLPTASEILADGEVTDEERDLARQAVYECVVYAGADTTFELFDVDPVVQRDYWDEYQACFADYMGLVLSTVQPGDRFDLGLIGVVECTEDRTGKYYGPKTVDKIGRLTDESRATIEKALNADEAVYKECYADLLPTEGWTEVYPAIIEYRFDNGDPKRISLKIAPCSYAHVARLVEETDTTITVHVAATGEGKGRPPCWIRHPVRLKNPLGDRVIIDEATGESIPADA